jgi:chromate transporter
MSPPERPSLRELALVFLKLGTISFGGPAAHIAMMEDEFVRRRQWLTANEFADRLAAANLIPGPSSTEVAIFIGYAKRGWLGLMVAGTCFIIPAAILVLLIAAAYVRYGSLPQVAGALYGIKPVVIAIIAQALWNLARTAVKTKLLGLLAVSCVILCFLRVDPLIVLAAAGLAAGVSVVLTHKVRTAFTLPLTPAAWMGLGAAAATVAAPISILRLFLSFLKMGAVVFGSGYVLLAFLRSEFVMRLHWLSEKQLIDAVAVGQFTPGPVFTTATFIGYLLAGIPGAVVATVGIFLPGFVLVALSGPVVPRLRRSATAGAILDGVVVGSLALMGFVAWQLARSAIGDGLTLGIAAVSLIAVIRFRINSVWLISAAALLGWIAKA